MEKYYEIRFDAREGEWFPAWYIHLPGNTLAEAKTEAVHRWYKSNRVRIRNVKGKLLRDESKIEYEERFKRMTEHP